MIRMAPTVTIVKSREDLLAGVEQEVELVIRAGSRAFDQVLLHFFSNLLIDY